MSSSSPNIEELRQRMDKIASQTEAIEQELEVSLEAAQEKYKKDRKAWKAYLLLQRVKGGTKFVAGAAVDHLTVIGSVVLEIPGLYSTMQHIERLGKIENMVGCHCGEKESRLPKQHCKEVLLPYIRGQKKRKLDHKTIGVLPIAGSLQTVADAVHAVEKEVDGSLHTVREQRAKELMTACKEGCLMANAIGAELLGWFSDISSQTKLQAYKEDSEGWRYLYRKMAPK